MKNWKWIALIILIVLAMWGGCEYGIRSVIKNTISDTATDIKAYEIRYVPYTVEVLKHDTFYTKKPKPDTVEIDNPVIIQLPDSTPDWLVDKINDYNLLRVYDTTLNYPDGVLRLTQGVQYNKLTTQEIEMEWRDTTITNTVIKKPPRKTIGYLTLSAGANWNATPMMSAGFQLKTKDERTFRFELKKVHGIKQAFVEFGTGIPIRLFNKNK